MAAILDFTHNGMSKVISDHTTRSCLPENPKVDTKIMNLFLLWTCSYYQKLYQFNV